VERRESDRDYAQHREERLPLGVKCNFCLTRSLLDSEELKAKHSSRPRLLSAIDFCRARRRSTSPILEPLVGDQI
jgi:hypothetical protein